MSVRLHSNHDKNRERDFYRSPHGLKRGEYHPVRKALNHPIKKPFLLKIIHQLPEYYKNVHVTKQVT